MTKYNYNFSIVHPVTKNGMRNGRIRRKGREMTHKNIMPSDLDKLLVEVFYQSGNDPFICGVIGHATAESLHRIEKDCLENKEDIFDIGDGNYLFEANWFSGQYGEHGQCEFPPCFELEIVAFEEVKEY